jgi:Tetracyclin repressor-like, C-terminal domain
MPAPRFAQIAAAFERGKERGEVRADLDVQSAVHALMGSFLVHYLSVGRPKRGWPERVADALWPAFAAP